jgi:hypothetical protein
MKKLLTILCVAACSLFAGQAAKAESAILGIGNHLGVDLNIGTTGIGVELSTPITPFVQARAGISIMPGIKFHVDSEVEDEYEVNGQYYSDIYDMQLDGSLKRVQGSLIFNIYPFGNKSSFFVALGGYFGGQDIVSITGSCPDAASLSDGNYVEVGNYRLPLDKNGNAEGSLRVKNFRPYVGIGFGRPCPSGRVNFMFDLGVQFHGTPYVYDKTNGSKLDYYNGEDDDDDTFQKIMDNVKIYPVLKFTISGRIF